MASASSSSTKSTQETVKIPSETPHWDLDAWVYTPVRSPSRDGYPVVIMAHGVGCTKSMGLASWAEAFCAAGYVCIVFDFRRWGASDGSPRNSIFISERLQDYRTIIKYCRRKDDYDSQKIVLWGYSFAGGHVLALSAEPELNIRATIALAPYTGRAFGFTLTWLCLRRVSLAIADIIKQTFGASPVYIPCVGPPGSVGAVTAAGAVEGLLSLATGDGDFPNQISASTYLRTPMFQPRNVCSFIACPVLMIAATGDVICPAKGVLEAASLAPNAETVKIAGGHFDMFPGQSEHERCVKAQVAFLLKHIPV
ncbi:hypothetical protein HGRIS_000848 [Hohenbuehelia grisea]|uniref:AB hydrolase-1 domain-containing protein n=1 Tax=Hohenbuehelia grisea TaxID=104357 RepID=A0ABR3IPX7_9AGAR